MVDVVVLISAPTRTQFIWEKLQTMKADDVSQVEQVELPDSVQQKLNPYSNGSKSQVRRRANVAAAVCCVCIRQQ